MLIVKCRVVVLWSGASALLVYSEVETGEETEIE